MVDETVTGCLLGECHAEFTALGHPADEVAQRSAACDREAGRGRLDRPPDAEREASVIVTAGVHGGRQGRVSEQSATEADHPDADRKQMRGTERGGEDHVAERDQTDEHAVRRDPIGVGAAAEQAGGDDQAGDATDGEHRRQRGRLADGQAQNLATVGLQQHVLHTEGRRPQGQREQAPLGLTGHAEGGPRLGEGRANPLRRRQLGLPRFLLPDRDCIEDERRERRTLDDTDQPRV